IDEMRCDERVEGACLYKVDLNDVANLERARATVMRTPEPAKEEKEERLPICPKCGVRQRPKILWFDESYNEAFFQWKTVMDQMETCDVLLIVGTQLTTGGPRSMVRAAQKSGAIIIRMDTEVDLKDDATAGMLHLQGKSGEVLPNLLPELSRLRKEPLLAPLAPPPAPSPVEGFPAASNP
ncbi:cobB, partial [Symbiodinium sp. KB8]